MKKTAFCFLAAILTFVNAVSAQSQFIDTSKTWNYLSSYTFMEPFLYSTQPYYFEGDTIMDSVQYVGVWKSDTNNSPHYFEGGIREDSGRVYFFEGVGDEKLIYDFNLEVGDEFVTLANQTGIVKSIDTVYIDSVPRKRWKFVLDTTTNQEFDEWIEGIGSVNRFFQVDEGVHNYYELLCHKENDLVIWQTTNTMWGGNCYYSNLGIKTNLNPQVKLYPNPTRNSLHLEFPNSLSGTLVIYNALGQPVISKSQTWNKNTLNIETLDQGVYNLIMVDKQGSKRYNATFIKD